MPRPARGDSISFTVTLSKAVSGGLKVTPSFTDVTATEGTDYTENTTALTFTGTAGETKSFTVATTEDVVAEAAETFTVGLAVSGTTATVTATDTATGTINDDDSAAVTVADASATEGNSISFTVTLDKAVAGGLKVTPGFTDVTATEGTDYTENTTALTFRRHGRGDQDLHGGHHRGHGCRAERDLHGRPDRLGDDGDGDGDRHGDGHDQRRRQFGGDDCRRLGQ